MPTASGRTGNSIRCVIVYRSAERVVQPATDTTPAVSKRTTWYWQNYRAIDGKIIASNWTTKLDEAFITDTVTEASRKLREINAKLPMHADLGMVIVHLADAKKAA